MRSPFVPTRRMNGNARRASRPDRRARFSRLCAAVAALLTLAACAITPPGTPVETGATADAACRALFMQTDQEVAAAGVSDARAEPVPDFPWLRIDRPLASFRHELATDAQFDAWLAHLSALDADARAVELTNLPRTAHERLTAHWQDAAHAHGLATEPGPALAQCRERLNLDIRHHAETRKQLIDQAAPPDAYVTWHRVVGLYWLTSRIAEPAIHRLHDRLDALLDADVTEPEQFIRHAVPTPANTPPAPRLPRDALGIPDPQSPAWAELFLRHAPVWAIETEGPADRPGALVLDETGTPWVDSARPVEYRHAGWTRFGETIVPQLYYTLWFPERPRTGLLDLYGGQLNAVTWRVTLNPDGTILAQERIHACGCYYALLPGAGWQVRDPPSGEEPVFTPGSAYQPSEEERVLIGIGSGTHYLRGITTIPATDSAIPLAPLPESTLRSLPRPDGAHASVYDANGLIPASRRPERFIFWPFGVRSAGAMRQHGQHAIAFVGRRHFDDAHLLETLLIPDTE